VNRDMPSRTAMIAAFVRAYHHRYDDLKIVDDPFAQALLSPAGMDAIETALSALAEADHPEIVTSDRTTTVRRMLRRLPAASGILARARYAEDMLVASLDGGVAQYVLVGAGLESFAFRRPDLAPRLRIFEIDHPSTQSYKRTAIARAGLAEPENLHFVAADLEATSVCEALGGSRFDPEVPAFFSWLGVVAYLTRPAIRDTLRSMRTVMAPESRLVFSYLDGDAFRPERASPGVRRMIERSHAIGEPHITGFDLADLRAELAAAGLALLENVDPEIGRASCRERV